MHNSKISNYNYLENLLLQLNVKYQKIDLDDGDLNYYIELMPGKLTDSIGIIEILMFYSYKIKKLVTICPRLYKIKKGDSTLGILTALNKTNSQLSRGSVTLNQDNYVSYKYIEEFKNIESITKFKITNIFSDIIAATIYTSEEIERLKNLEK